MFLKLFKYDFRTSARFGVPILLAIAAAAVVGAVNTGVTVAGAGNESTFDALTNAPFGEMLIFFGMGGLLLVTLVLSAAAVVMSVLLLVQYYRTTAADEAYLTFTLPVTPAQILWSKLLNTLVWLSFCGIAILLAGAAVLGTGITAAGIAEDFLNTFAELFSFLFSFTEIGTVLLLCALGAASTTASLLMLFMAITFGAVIARRHKALAAVGMICLIRFVMSGVTSVLQAILLGDFTLKLVFDEGMASVNIFLLSCTILHTALAAVYFLAARHMLENKLNLD